MNSERQRSWTRYWRSGALHSCVGSYDDNYGGAIAAFWRERFNAVTPNSRVIDLATGNGPLPALMVETLGVARTATVDAVDFSEPRPAWSVPPRIRFHAGVNMEALPFDEATFDAAYSQFGFEYADREAATRELVRVIKPHAAIALVCHHADSQLVQVARAEVEHTDWLLDESGLVPTVRALLPLAERQDLRLREAFNTALQPLDARARASRYPDALHDAGQTFFGVVQLAAERGARAANKALTDSVEALPDARLRSAELIECALDRSATERLAASLDTAGHPVVTGELYEGDYLVGWTVVSRR